MLAVLLESRCINVWEGGTGCIDVPGSIYHRKLSTGRSMRAKAAGRLVGGWLHLAEVRLMGVRRRGRGDNARKVVGDIDWCQDFVCRREHALDGAGRARLCLHRSTVLCSDVLLRAGRRDGL